MIKVSIIKRIDSLLGPALIPLVKWLCSSRNARPDRIDKVLVIRPGGIGDAVLLIPAIQEIKKKFPAAAIYVLAEKRNFKVFSLCPEVNAVFRYDGLNQLRSAIRGTYDVVIDTEQWHRLSAVVARLTGASMLIGFATNKRKELFTHPVQYSQDDYEVKSFVRLMEPVIGNAEFDTVSPFLIVQPDFKDKARALLSPISGRKIVALFPGGSIPERRWGGSRFRQTAMLLSEQGYGIVAVGGRNDFGEGELITGALPFSINLCGRQTLPETAAVLQRVSLLITGDSGIMHIGHGLGIKVVALFGPGRENKWAPREKNCKVINKNLSCSPCTTFGYTPKCKRNAECMKQITVEEVVAESMTLLRQ